MEKYYAVKAGRKIGIFNLWKDCEESIKGFSQPEYKLFNSKEEAEAYLSDKDLWDDIIKNDINQGYIIAFCDGSYEKTLNRYSYGVLIINKDQTQITLCGYGNNEKYISSNNIIGEILGVINALDWAISNGYSKIKIYHDYEGLSKWISGEWNAKSDIAQMYTNLYKTKFEGLIEVKFEKVKGHSNNKYNDKVDALAKSALFDKTKIAIKGDNWYVLPYFDEFDFQKVIDLIKEENENIKVTKKDYTSKSRYEFNLYKHKIIATQFKSKGQKLLIQGQNSILFQIIISIIIELYDINKIDSILNSAFRTTINKKTIDNSFNTICPNLPHDYPENIKCLIRQSIINLNYFIESEEYSQYVFSALRALEGHIKYLLTKAGITVNKNFNVFNKDISGLYVLTARIADISQKAQIEKCYNYYKAERDTLFHFGDIFGSVDTTRLVNTKDEANEIIQKCINLICEQ